MLRCHKCGYSNQYGAKSCVKCRTSLDGEETGASDASDQMHQSRKTIVMPGSDETPWDQERVVPMRPNRPLRSSQTVRRVVPDPTSCHLIAISMDDEKELRKIDVKGDSISLNRSILDPANNSISRNGHANIYQKDGKWYLENTTAMRTTFIRVDQPIQLAEGDVLLLGDSLFKFKMGKLESESQSDE